MKGRVCHMDDARGLSVIELLVVIAVIAIISVIALPQISSARRQLRFGGVAREVMTQLRYARQQAMSTRQAHTFRYDDQTKQITIINNGEVGVGNTSPDRIVRTVSLAVAGLSASEIIYGALPNAPTTLPDGTSFTPLASGRVEIIFQPDGSVVNSAQLPINYALFFYDQGYPTYTATAISVLGAAGRVKIWRFDPNANAYKE
ncbi:GspH/FimT family pseudopilin [Pyrinomonas sp.]|uniref:GspH/FimT family pseudopilin n=1 Tax=Pyrinomonas sp. TaxID=2080306 RepID=UPI003317F44D